MRHIQAIARSSVTIKGFEDADKKIANKYVYTGYSIVIFLFLSIFIWSAYAPISSAAIATGVVGKDGHRKTVQHLEGGIIEKILIRDGDPVKAHQALIELRGIQSRSDFDLIRKQLLIAVAKKSCLVAEVQDKSEVSLVFSSGVKLAALDESVQDSINGLINAFHVRVGLHRDQLAIIDQRIQQAKRKISALKRELNTLNSKGLIIAEEQKEYQKFEKKGLVTRAQVFSLKRDKASNETDITANRVSIESTRQEINDLKMEKSTLTASNKKRIASDLDNARSQLVDLNEKLSATQDKLGRTVIRAPIEGVIVDLKVHTIGGVIQPGEALLDIVPKSGKLIVDAHIDPKDRDTVKVGQAAEIRFTAFNQRITEPVPGKVVLISADRLIDSTAEGKQSAYYKAKIELLEDPSEVINGVSVYPGMQADVMIVTGKRTALEYFLKPILKSFNQAFRDD